MIDAEIEMDNIAIKLNDLHGLQMDPRDSAGEPISNLSPSPEAEASIIITT